MSHDDTEFSVAREGMKFLNSPQPSVGRVVHYVSYGTPGSEFPMACRAATVAEVGAWVDDPTEPVTGEWESDDGVRHRELHQTWDPTACHLVVQNPTGQFFNVVPQDEVHHRGGTWHWPERV